MESSSIHERITSPPNEALLQSALKNFFSLQNAFST